MAMDFASAATRVRTLIASKKPRDLSRSTLTPDPLRDNVIAESAIDTKRFRDAVRTHPEIEYEAELEDGTKEQRSFTWDSFPEALRDVARAGFGFDEPEILAREQVKASHQLNRELMANYVGSEEFEGLRPYTRGNETESLFGALASADSLKASAQTRLAEHVARAQEMAEQEEAAQSADDMLENLRKRAREQHDATGQVDDKTKREVKGQVKARQAAREKLADLLQQQAASSFHADVRAAGQAAAQAGADAVDAIGSLPGIGGGHAHNLTPDQQIALAEKWSANKELRKIAQMLGRMYRDMRFKRDTRTKNVPIEPVSITTGREISRLLPQELARAMHPELRALFVKDYAEHALLEYEMEGKIPAGKGPIIEVHDGSGSMAGESFVWATSVALCLLTLAQREKRAFAGVEFGSASQVKSWFFPKGKPADPNEVLDFASHFYGGGTHTVGGMAEALRICKDEPGFKTADVVLIGDGQDHFTAEDQAVRDELRRMGVRIHGISIMTGHNAYMEQMCDWTRDVTDLAGANDETSALAANLT